MPNVIREDVVKVDFLVDGLKELAKLQDDIDNLKKILTGGIGDDAFDDLKNSANESADSLEDVKKAANKTKDGLEKVKETAKNASSKLLDLGKKGAVAAFNGLKKLAGISFKALMVGVGALAGAVGKIGYEAVQAFADFEQLKGGVETLFGAGGLSIEEYAKSIGKSVVEAKGQYEKLIASQDTVFKNANNAYKTAGLSANAYMETVTSFSASLIQSCGGDTAEAAKLADMAISDMSDNANKMGTDMGSIQYAYQGFAKQNYTIKSNSRAA